METEAATTNHTLNSPGALGERARGINGRYRSTKCPRHRQFQPLVRKFIAHCIRVPFWVGVLHYPMYSRVVLAGMYSGCRLLVPVDSALIGACDPITSVDQ